MLDTGGRLRTTFRSSARALRGQAGSGVVIFVSTIVAGLLAYASTAVSARTLGSADFGLLGALLGTASLVTVALRPLHSAATHLATELHARGEDSAVAGLAGPSLLAAVGAAAALLTLAAVLAEPLSVFYRTTEHSPVLALALLLAVTAYVQLATGFLLGLHRFNSFAVSNVLDTSVRAALTPLLVSLLSVPGALACYVIGQAAAAMFSVVQSGGVRWKPPGAAHVLRATRVGLSSSVLTLVVALLQHADLVLLRAYAPAEQVGWYSASASVGSLVFTLAAPVYLPLYPRLVASTRAGQSAGALLLGTLGLVSVVGAAMILASALIGGRLTALLFGDEFVAAGAILPLYLAKTASLLSLFLVGQYAIVAGRASLLWPSLVPCLTALAVLAIAQPAPSHAALLGFVAAAGCTLTVGLPLAGVQRK